jgi:hypothetical protein
VIVAICKYREVLDARPSLAVSGMVPSLYSLNTRRMKRAMIDQIEPVIERYSVPELYSKAVESGRSRSRGSSLRFVSHRKSAAGCRGDGPHCAGAESSNCNCRSSGLETRIVSFDYARGSLDWQFDSQRTYQVQGTCHELWDGRETSEEPWLSFGITSCARVSNRRLTPNQKAESPRMIVGLNFSTSIQSMIGRFCGFLQDRRRCDRLKNAEFGKKPNQVPQANAETKAGAADAGRGFCDMNCEMRHVKMANCEWPRSRPEAEEAHRGVPAERS